VGKTLKAQIGIEDRSQKEPGEKSGRSASSRDLRSQRHTDSNYSMLQMKQTPGSVRSTGPAGRTAEKFHRRQAKEARRDLVNGSATPESEDIGRDRSSTPTQYEMVQKPWKGEAGRWHQKEDETYVPLTQKMP